MSDEKTVPVAESTEQVEKIPEPTPEEVEAKGTTEPEAETETPEEDAESKAIKAMKKRIDRQTRKYYEAKARADLLESQLRGQPEQRKELDPNQFESNEDYIEALVEKRLQEKEAIKAQQSKADKIGKILKAAEKEGDFDIDDFKEVKISRMMAEAIVESDVAPKLVKYFHDDPEEAERIAGLSEARQAVEIGKIEDRLSGDTPAKPAKKSAAPAPIKPISGGKTTELSYRPDMSLKEYARLRGSKMFS